MQHPVTTEYSSAGNQIYNTLKATNKIKMKKIFFWPNVDAGSEQISEKIRTFLGGDSKLFILSKYLCFIII